MEISNLRNICPPALWKTLKIIFKKEFVGNYARWEEAKSVATIFRPDVFSEIVNKTKEAALKVKSGKAAYQRSSVLYDKIQYDWPLLSSLLWVASLSKNRLNLVDFGGSLGISYFQNRKFFSHLEEFKWNIVELPEYVQIGKQLFEDGHLKFYYKLEDCVIQQKPNTILFSSSIQCVEDPYSVLRDVVETGFRYIIFDATSFVQKGNDRLTIHRISSWIHKGTGLEWFLSLEKFLKFFSEKYELVADFDFPYEANIVHSCFKGFIFTKK